MILAALSLLAIAALLPLWRTARVTSHARLPALLGSLAAVACIVSAARWEPPGAADSGARPAEVLVDGYVGSRSCRACHPGEHASWQGSFHRSMTQVASRENVLADFERLELDWYGQPVLLEWRGDRLWTVFERGGRRPGRIERPIEQLTGSHHLQVLWYSTGEQRELGPLPMCFKVEEGLWIPLMSVFVLPPEVRDPPEPGVWNQSCAMCHTTDPRPRVDLGRTDTEVGEFGISCEACHGPGEAHVAANRDPLRRLAQRARGVDDTILNPETMPPARSAEVCGHCHSVSILRAQHFDGWREHGSPFEPGDQLLESHLVIDVDDGDAPELQRALRRNPDFFASSFWSDGVVRLSGREFSGMRRSGCYTHDDQAGRIDCTSCHGLHAADGVVTEAWRDGQMRTAMQGDGGCTQCHDELSRPEALQAHTLHAPESLGSRCYDCHMSHTSIGLMKASRSHAIESPSVATELATGRPNACNQCHLDQTLQWTAQQLERGWGIEAPELAAEQRDLAASVRWLLAGDAGQRMLAAWSFGWGPAQQTSGTDWMVPYLARLLDDPYHVVRFNAARSLRSLGGFDRTLDGYDHLAPPGDARRFVVGVTSRWQAGHRGAARPALLLTATGLDTAAFADLYARRDNRKMYLAE